MHSYTEMLVLGIIFILLSCSVGAQDTADSSTTYPPKVVEGSEEMCPDTRTLRQEITTEVREILREAFPINCTDTSHAGQSQRSPIFSCSVLPTDCPSGYYWVTLPNGTVAQAYCSTNRQCSCSNRGWTRIAHLNMSDPSEECPEGFRLITSPVRTCGRPEGQGSCVSKIFQANGIEYQKVCGRIIAYQYASPDAFAPYDHNRQIDIDGLYADGVSITHGNSPRKHIWTFAAAVDETRSNAYVCPCTRADQTYTGTVPPFIGQDYFCETGSRGAFQFGRFYDEDPLWDGMGCASFSTCCSFNNPPWFCKELPQPTTDDVELRLCGDQHLGDEDNPIELIDLYVQ